MVDSERSNDVVAQDEALEINGEEAITLGDKSGNARNVLEPFAH